MRLALQFGFGLLMPSRAAVPADFLLDSPRAGELVRTVLISFRFGLSKTFVLTNPLAGLFTRRALLRGAVLVVAVEPSPENEDCLRRTFARDIADGRVIVYAKRVLAPGGPHGNEPFWQ